MDKMLLLALAALSIVSCNEAQNKTTISSAQPVKSEARQPKNPRLLLESTFDEPTLGSALAGWNDQQHDTDAPWARTLSNKTLRFELRRNDAIVSSSRRSEITREGAGELWFGGRVFLENWQVDDGGESIIQWHSEANCPPLSLTLYGSDVILVQCPNGGLIQNKVGTIEDFNNKWVDLVFHIKWSHTDGLLQFWKDGQLLVDKKDLDMGTPNANLKLGINKWPWAPNGGSSKREIQSRVFYWDDFRIGNETASFKDVDPRQGSKP